MPEINVILLGFVLSVVAFLYSSVGHAGASGYIAVMTLLGANLIEIKPIALTLNILVASVTAYQFWRAGYFSWSLFFPFALLSVPAAFFGGFLNLPIAWLRILLGSVLLFSAFRFFYDPRETEHPAKPRKVTALLSGAMIGLLSGFTGTGGGIFLTPLMLSLRWARTKPSAAVSAMFILVNSIAGLIGNFTATKKLPPSVWLFACCVIVGGSFGSYYGSNRYPVAWVKRSLAAVLAIAGIKLVMN